MASENITKILDEIKALSVTELFDLEKAIEEERVLEAYWNADPVYREVAMDILVQHPAKKANEAMSAG